VFKSNETWDLLHSGLLRDTENSLSTFRPHLSVPSSVVSAKGRKTRYFPCLNLMEIEICLLLSYYAALTIPYRRFGITYRSHLQQSVLKEGKQCRFLCLI
jgi:hypothetical protein